MKQAGDVARMEKYETLIGPFERNQDTDKKITLKLKQGAKAMSSCKQGNTYSNFIKDNGFSDQLSDNYLLKKRLAQQS